jgi:hypothetical protein
MIGPPVAEPELAEPPGLGQARVPVPGRQAELAGGGPSRHRRHSRAGTWLAALAVLIGVVVAGGAISDQQLTTDERFREFVVTGEPGRPVSTTTFTVVVLEVRAVAVVTDDTGRPYTTGGVWLLARVRAYGIDEPAEIGYAAVRDSRGRTWLATARVEQPLAGGGYQLQPGIPVESEIAFEVPTPAATDLTIRLATASFDLRLDTVVEVPLPVDGAAVTAALAEPEPEPVRLAEPEVVIADPQVLRDAGEATR